MLTLSFKYNLLLLGRGSPQQGEGGQEEEGGEAGCQEEGSPPGELCFISSNNF